jgi:predicted DCC family thiol-disulfide oxidoreductase YuxK
MNEKFVVLQTAFAVSFAAIAAIVFFAHRFVPQSGTVLSRFGTFLQTRSFPVFTPYEHNRLAVLRFFFGLILLLRAIDVASLLLPEEYFMTLGYFSAFEIIFALCVMFGFATQFALGFFMLVMWILGEDYLGTITLGNDVGAMVALFLLLTEAGRTFSIDAYVVKKIPFLRPVFGYGSHLPGNESIAVAKFVMLFSYWLVCMYSLMIHLNEPAWMTGVTGPMLFVNNFMSRFHYLIEPIMLQSTLAVLAARLSLVVMMVWYAALLPFVLLGGWWRIAAIIWGVLFFLLSSVGLQLGSLAYIEMILWIACFWPQWGVDSSKKLLLFYDDKCNLCDRTVQFVRRVDFFDRVSLTPVSKNHDLLATYGISVEAALEDLHGVIPGENNVAAGYDLYLLLARHVLVLWLALPMLWLGKILAIGPAVYRFVAARRRAMFGVCVLPRPKPEWVAPVQTQLPPSLIFNMVVWHAIFLGLAYAIAIPVPYMGHKGYNKHPLAQAARVYGDTHIDVFNSIDLKMMDNWFTLTDVETNTLLPIFDTDGSRFALHRSDRVYFGNTLRFRRSEIFQTGCGYTRWEKHMDYLTQVWMHNVGLTGTREIRFTQYHRPHPDQDLVAQNIYRKNPVEVRCEVTFTSMR